MVRYPFLLTALLSTLLALSGLASVGSTAERRVPRELSAHASISWRRALGQPDAWYVSDEATRIADNVLLFQRDTGGWEKNLEMAHPIGPAERERLLQDKSIARSTIDNGATYTPMRYLARVYGATHEDRFAEAFLAGLDYLLKAQYDNGGWPQFYPIRRGYYQHITFNDNAMINVMRLLRDIAEERPGFAFVDTARRTRAKEAVERGLEVILKCQVRVEGKLTVWCAQHDEETLAPAKARSYELPSLSGSESVGILEFLMEIENPSDEVRQAIEGGCAWFADVPILGLRVTRDRNAATGSRPDRIAVEDPDAPRLWARFYEIGTNRPLYVDRDGVPRPHFNDLSAERRNGYGYLGGFAEQLLTRDYPAWKEKWAHE